MSERRWTAIQNLSRRRQKKYSLEFCFIWNKRVAAPKYFYSGSCVSMTWRLDLKAILSVETSNTVVCQ